MLFSTPVFLFGFFPMAVAIYYLTPRKFKNTVLLFTSLIFYAWGEMFYLGIMLVSILVNYFIGQALCRSFKKSSIYSSSKVYLVLGIALNLLLLFSFKYANFISDNLNTFFYIFNVPVYINLIPIHLPLGISFFTFQAISYIVDVYRKDVPAQSNVFNLALYISLFPQLIAGPIVRYHQLSSQITERVHTAELFASGARRFIYGLAKKVLVADSLAKVADSAFSLYGSELTMPLAWIGILAYSLQIYFDFSGYSDMAIGLGRMFGFRFLENFNYPYISTSIREFWRRWHISLSTWFRDYVYISLGGNRVTPIRVYLNLLVVFVLTGFWHGASWNFLLWGLFHGLFLASEHAGLNKIIKKIWKPVQHFYVLFVILIGWVFFRSDTVSLSFHYLGRMFDYSSVSTTAYQFSKVLTNESIIIFFIGIIYSMPVFKYADDMVKTKCKTSSTRIIYNICHQLTLFMLLILTLSKIASSTYSPFLYFRF